MTPRLFAAALASVGVLGAAPTAPPPVQPTPPPDNPVRPAPIADGTNPFEGTYVVVAGEADGKPVPKDRLDGLKFTITKDTITGTDAAGKHFLTATYTVNATEKPSRWKLRPNGSEDVLPVFALVEQSGPTLKMVYNLPGGPIPKRFETGENQRLYELRRATADGVPPAEKK